MLTQNSHFVRLGAFVTIAMVSVEPITQQIVTYPSLQIEAGKSTMRRVQNWNFSAVSQRTNPDVEPTFLDISISTAIYQGLFTNPGRPDYVCPTGNCTWDYPVTSLSLCSACQDVSEQIRMNLGAKNGAAKYSLPSGLNLTSNYSTLSQYPNCPATEKTFIPEQLMRVTSAGSTSGNVIVAISAMTSSQAFECTIQPCVKEYNVSVSSNILDDTIISTWQHFIYNGYGYPANLTLSLGEYDQLGTENPVFEMAYDHLDDEASSSYFLLSKYLQGLFTGFLPGPCNLDDTIMDALGDYGEHSPDETSYDLNPLLPPTLTNFPATIANITSSMSASLLNKPNTEVVTGTAWRRETYIHVQWQWLIYPFSLAVLSTIFFGLTLYNNKGLMLWKSSASPLLFHGLAERHRGGSDSNMGKVSEMNKAAEKPEVRLVNNEGRWELV